MFTALQARLFCAAVAAAAGVTVTAPTADDAARVYCNPAGRELPDKAMEQVRFDPARTLLEQDRVRVADCASNGKLIIADKSNFFMLSPWVDYACAHVARRGS